MKKPAFPSFCNGKIASPCHWLGDVCGRRLGRWLLAGLVVIGLSPTAKAQAPPTIITNPVATLLLVQGGSATIAAAAEGGANAGGYWLASSVPGVWGPVSSPDFSGATSTMTVGVDQAAALELTNFQASDAGSYEFVVTNASGSATSTVAVLSLLPNPPACSFEAVAIGYGAVALWPLNETTDPSTGTAVAYDIIGGWNGSYGTNADNGGGNAYTGAPATAGPGAYGLIGLPTQGALGCTNGVAQNTVTTAGSFTLPAMSTNLTIVAWIYPTVSLEPGGAGLVMTGASGVEDGLCYSTFYGSPETNYLGDEWNNGNQDNQSLLSPPVTNWSMAAMVITATNTTMYVCCTNLVSSATQIISNAYQSWGSPITVGGDPLDAATGALNFSGSISSVAMFANALSVEQISMLYYAGALANCTQGCLTVTCATNKTVECGSSWTFDPPTASSCCANVTITSAGIVTNGICPLVITETWLITDGCTNSATCSQTVTVECTDCLEVVCATNKTVECGSSWTFDPPSAATSCGGNVTITSAGIVTNGVCPQLITQTWLITDTCGDSSNCSQTVTVQDTTPPVLTCASSKVVPYGQCDMGLTTLHIFTNGTDGARTQSGLILSGNTLYGTATYGGSSGHGTLFSVNTDGTDFTTLYSFTNGSDGAAPEAGLVMSGSVLYGTAAYGGDSGAGTVFSFDTGAMEFYTLYAFTNGADGGNPQAGLILSGDTLYGAATYGGSTGYGTLFAINTNGLGFTNLYSFTNGTDGARPESVLILSDNTLYGTAEFGGTSGYGTVFSVTTNGTNFQTLYSFTNGSDGGYPVAGLVLSGNTLYGTTPWSGITSYGTVFSITTNGAGFASLVEFGAFDYNSLGQLTNNGGLNPESGLILSGDTLYGTTEIGGTFGFGAVFSVSTNGGDVTALWNFTQNSDGAYPFARLILSGNTLYGTTAYGTSSDDGAVFGLCIGAPGWSFDAPTAVDACSGTNVAVTVLSTVTNGVCPMAVTRTWLATDACGNTSTCSQTVTVECTNCFEVVCPTNKTVEGGSSWTFDPPTASSCCSNLTILSTGIVTNGICPQYITNTWIISDACGNTDMCSQVVTVECANCLQVVCAGNMTVQCGTNWSFDPPVIVDSCCGANYTVTSNTVTAYSANPCAYIYTCTWQVTDCLGNTATCSQTVTNFPCPCQDFNTGMSGAAALATGATDPNFVLVSTPAGAPAPPAALVIDPSSANATYALQDGPDSQWIGPDTTDAWEPAGVYHYQIQFLVCCTNCTALGGQMAADNLAGVYLNGQFAAFVPGPGSWSPISINSGFVPGLNLLDIYLTNASSLNQPGFSQTAFRAELTNCCCSYNPISIAVAPVPNSACLLIDWQGAQSITYTNYQILLSTNLANTNWTTLTNTIPFQITPTGTAQFFRLVSTNSP